MIPPFRPSTGLLPSGDAAPAHVASRAYIDGSFVTAKEEPGDVDGCWETNGVDPVLLAPGLVTFDPYRCIQKAKYGRELFFADAPADPAGTAFIDFFQRDRPGHPKDIVALDLGALA